MQENIMIYLFILLEIISLNSFPSNNHIIISKQYNYLTNAKISYPLNPNFPYIRLPYNQSIISNPNNL